MNVSVTKLDDRTFEVAISGRTATTHTVTVTPDYWRKLTGGKVDAGRLVEKSFDFLLERERNTSILGRFDLPVIQRYFPEYEETIGRMLD